MRPETEQRVAEIIENALECEPGERDRFVREACADDPELAAEVSSLLRAHAEAGGFLETPAIALSARTLLAPSPELPTGHRIGGYKVLSLLGEGGMGEVYLADDLELGRKVAIKVIKRSLGRAGILRHFRQEERILAGLNDPHIARLYEAAVTPEGVPYFVMEYVNGQRLDEYCDERRLALEDRLLLFRKVCSAVAYAHQHLVIHRDLKPANIRVTADGEPKLLDFGIAKLVDPTRPSPAEPTVTVVGMMTPAYASPEQIRGELMTTVSDVYSLGVLLYELLAGPRPREPIAVQVGVTRGGFEATDPPAPSVALLRAGSSAAVFSARRGMDPVRLARRLAGDLDNIVLMAMRREPERRYASAGQLSDDIRRHLEGLPVVARKDTLAYRSAKFVRRHRTGVAAAALVGLTLVGGIVATTWQARRAERRFEEVRRLAHSLMFEIHDSIQNLDGSTPTRRLIVSRALEYLESLAQESGGNAALQRELAAAYEKIGEIQGNPYSANLGDTDGALASYGKAIGILEKLSGSEANTETRAGLARCYRALADVLELKGEMPEMIRQYQKSLDAFEAISQRHPDDRVLRREVARAWEALGDGWSRMPNAEGKQLDSYRRSLSIVRELAAAHPGDLGLRRAVAVGLLKVGGARGTKADESISNQIQAIEILQELSAAEPQNARARREVGFACSSLGMTLQASGDYEQALRYQRKALALREETATRDPKSAQARLDLAGEEANLCGTLTLAGQGTDAIAYGLRSAANFEQLTASDPANVSYSRNSGLCFENLGGAFALLGANDASTIEARTTAWNSARDWYEKARAVFVALRKGGTITARDRDKPELYEAKVGECKAALAALRP